MDILSPGATLNTYTIAEGDTPVAMLRARGDAVGGQQRGQNNFWSCFAGCMIGKIGAGAWNNLKNNYLTCWNGAQSQNKWWKKVKVFLGCIFTLPYGQYALQCGGSCR